MKRYLQSVAAILAGTIGASAHGAQTVAADNSAAALELEEVVVTPRTFGLTVQAAL